VDCDEGEPGEHRRPHETCPGEQQRPSLEQLVALRQAEQSRDAQCHQLGDRVARTCVEHEVLR